MLIGNPGVGKTFLSKIVGWRICQANQRILFTTAMDMLNHLLASQVDHSLVRKLKTYTEPAFLSSTSSVTWRSISRLPISFIKSSPPATARSAAPLLPRTQPSPTGATSSSTPPSPPPSPTGWWRTPKSSCWEATACASPRIRIRRPSSRAGSEQAPRCAITRHGGVRRANPSTALPMGAGASAPASGLILSAPCSTSAPITCSCSRGRNTVRARCS